MAGRLQRTRFKLIRWGGQRVNALWRLPELKLDHCPALWEVLDWGPQHVDLTTQQLMRRCYHRWPSAWITDFDAHIEALDSGDEVLFWCEPSLGNCLAILWALDTLATRGADLRRAFLALSPVKTVVAQGTPGLVARTISVRVPVAELLGPLLAIRRHLASDSDTVPADLSPLPAVVRDWARVTDRLEDFLPDEKGLDLIDTEILGLLSEGSQRGRTWRRASGIITAGVTRLAGPASTQLHDIGDECLWQRLLELAGVIHPLRWPPTPKKRLVEVRFGEELTHQQTFVRNGLLGQRVLVGEVDALHECQLERWVGGRLVSASRPLRRSPNLSPGPSR